MQHKMAGVFKGTGEDLREYAASMKIPHGYLVFILREALFKRSGIL